MEFNTVLRSLRYALDYTDQQMAEVFALDGYKVDPSTIVNMLKHEEQDGFLPVDEIVLGHFLDGFITQKRGPADPARKVPEVQALDNNMVIKKLRIALELREEDMIKTIGKGGFVISKSELSALFRKKGHKHYRECGDQLLRNFLKGLSIPD
ncbi:DUF1456 family protein [Oceanispirochaeta sp.]|jgi:uncharacterized protein YehS (DUF1456 family)|uniref:DUF1456 family protein n=1 Tax=Oceanispirochaeta sp. TaxID=2035350 RepID=UPI00261A81DF|nr:DUF1456 family protein [Oceanispirochaeta sp.]MDA3956161.1 DUF1456 family protein [Oceanispirochaeta sp.]